ncbi:MAG: hypothetical protein LBB05_01520 [Puniceicoccales bacterium]|nr:hypothetical protein [Puniceicoccales bacterium]
MSDISSLQSFDTSSLSRTVSGRKSCIEPKYTLPDGTMVKVTPLITHKKFKFSSHSAPSDRLLHKRVSVSIGAQEFQLRISGNGKKLKIGGKIGSEKNRESFQNMLEVMKTCQQPAEKLHLLNLMASLDPESTKSELAKNGDDLGIFRDLFDREGHPGDAFISLNAFRSYLEEKGIDTTQLEKTIQLTYENLKLGRLEGKIYGGERKRLHFSQSNLAKNAKSIKVLRDIASIRDRFKSTNNGHQDIFNSSSPSAIQFPSGSGISFDGMSNTFVNSNRTMEACFNILDWDGFNPKKMPISEGQRLGLITPEKAQELQAQGLQDFTPLYISFRPTQTFGDMRADVRNIAGGVPKNVRDTDIFAQTIIANLAPGVVPIFTGHSMGGMLAHVAGAKHNCASIGFNPLGLGEGVRKFIDDGDGSRCERANDVAHAECHPSFAMEGDWVSDGQGSQVARSLVKKPYIGQRYMMPIEDDNIRKMWMNKRHNMYTENFEAAYRKVRGE